jgi:hypothetical protein
MVIKRSLTFILLALAMMIGFSQSAFATTYGPVSVSLNTSLTNTLAAGDGIVYILPNTGQTTMYNVAASVQSANVNSILCYYSAYKGGQTINLGQGYGGGGVTYLSPGEYFIIRLVNTSSSAVSYTITFTGTSS